MTTRVAMSLCTAGSRTTTTPLCGRFADRGIPRPTTSRASNVGNSRSTQPNGPVHRPSPTKLEGHGCSSSCGDVAARLDDGPGVWPRFVSDDGYVRYWPIAMVVVVLLGIGL